jgi:hypothetical protein
MGSYGLEYNKPPESHAATALAMLTGQASDMVTANAPIFAAVCEHCGTIRFFVEDPLLQWRASTDPN